MASVPGAVDAVMEYQTIYAASDLGRERLLADVSTTPPMSLEDIGDAVAALQLYPLARDAVYLRCLLLELDIRPRPGATLSTLRDAMRDAMRDATRGQRSQEALESLESHTDSTQRILSKLEASDPPGGDPEGGPVEAPPR